jgi:protoporphyrinogen oxidase
MLAISPYPCVPSGREKRARILTKPSKSVEDNCRVVILGAGPAGLTAAYELSSNDVPSVVLEQDSVVGGLARTVEHEGYRFDIGGHRFYTKVALVEKIWREILGDDLLTRRRLSRIYYKSRFFRYPLEPFDAVRGLGLLESVRCALSFARSRLFPTAPENDFATWVSNRFGRRLFDVFFKSYTEKVWGMDCREISAEWAAQRIQGLSVGAMLRDALLRGRGKNVKTLIREFQYPRLGPGMLWTRMKAIVEQRGVEVALNSAVERVEWEQGRVTSVTAGGKRYGGSHFISSIPIRELIERLDPAAPPQVRAAAAQLRYRDFVTVAIIVRGRNLFPDNWIYIHDPSVSAGRIQNYNNWSPDMTPNPDMTCLGMEYFCNQNDNLWERPDEDLIRLARKELVQLGLVREQDIVQGAVVRMPKAYPVYDSGYRNALATIRDFLSCATPNLQLVGRNGMHRYNNQDHSMLTAILAARNVMGWNFDLWKLNTDAQHVESGPALGEQDFAALERTQPLVPRAV